MSQKETFVQRITREIKDFNSLYKTERKIFFLVVLMLLGVGLYFFVADMLPAIRGDRTNNRLQEKSVTKLENGKVTTASETNINGQKQETMRDSSSIRKEKENVELPLFQGVKRATVAMVVFHEGNLKQPYTILGSGFCIHSKGIIVTCRHVVDGFMNKPVQQKIAELPKDSPKEGLQPISPVNLVVPYAVFFDTESSDTLLFARFARVGYIIAELDYDVALLKLHPHDRYPKGFPYLDVEEYRNIYEGMDIATCGFPLGNYLKEQIGTVTSSFTKGSVSAIIPGPNVSLDILKGFQLDLTATYGSSGGPVFCVKSGRVLGVLQGGLKSFPGIVKAEPIQPVIKKGTLDRILSAPLQ